MRSDIRTATVNGLSLAYQVLSEGSGRPPALFVHGYSGRSTSDAAYPELLDALAEAFTVYALDLRGHGASASQTDGFSMTACADDVAAFARALGIEGSVYIGHSFGGFTGLYSEVRHPKAFSALCLIATAAAGGGGHAGPEAGPFLIEYGKNPEALMLAVSPMYVREGGDLSAHIEAVTLVDLDVHRVYFPEYLTRSILDDIGGIHIPVLVLNGAKDTVVPLWSQHETALALPLCKEVIFTSEGHMLPLEAPQMTAREILSFCRHDAPDLRRRA